jgi:hypothetical protein
MPPAISDASCDQNRRRAGRTLAAHLDVHRVEEHGTGRPLALTR